MAPGGASGAARSAYVDALRGIAVLMVILCHSANATGGTAHAWWGSAGFQLYTGAAIFFGISGFLLYRPYLAARESGRPEPSPLRFYRRRALRILPAYWAALTLLAVWPGLDGVFTSHWWVYYGLGQVYSLPTHANGLAVAWTLCIEASFYLVLPLYAALLSRLTAGREPRRRVAIELLGVAAFGLPALAVQGLGKAGVIPFETTRTLLGTSDWLAIGMGLAVLSVAFAGDEGALSRTRRLASRPTVCLGLAVAVFASGAALVDVRDIVAPSWVAYVSNHVVSEAVTVLVMLPAVFALSSRGAGARILGSPPLRWIGLVSYGLFLWHYPLVRELSTHVVPLRLPLWAGTLLLFAITLAVTLVPAVVSYRLIELPAMRRRRTAQVTVATPEPARAGVS